MINHPLQRETSHFRLSAAAFTHPDMDENETFRSNLNRIGHCTMCHPGPASAGVFFARFRKRKHMRKAKIVIFLTFRVDDVIFHI